VSGGNPAPAGRLHRRMKTIAVALALVHAIGAAAAQDRHAHAHGVVVAEATLDGPSLDVTLRIPLDSLLGFERAPRSDAEKRAAQALVERLRRDATLVQPGAAAGCARTGVELVSAALGLGSAPADADGHAELEARWRFGCTAPDRLAHIELGIVGAYKRIARVDAAIVAPKGQTRQVLKRPAQRLAWPK
jgi:hypothetical protein